MTGLGNRPSLPEGWEPQGTGECRSCHAPVTWARHSRTGSRAPFNPDGISHYATCPQAPDWRKKR